MHYYSAERNDTFQVHEKVFLIYNDNKIIQTIHIYIIKLNKKKIRTSKPLSPRPAMKPRGSASSETWSSEAMALGLGCRQRPIRWRERSREKKKVFRLEGQFFPSPMWRRGMLKNGWFCTKPVDVVWRFRGVVLMEDKHETWNTSALLSFLAVKYSPSFLL